MVVMQRPANPFRSTGFGHNPYITGWRYTGDPNFNQFTGPGGTPPQEASFSTGSFIQPGAIPNRDPRFQAFDASVANQRAGLGLNPGNDSASLFNSASALEQQRENERLAEGRGMSLQQGLGLAPPTTTTGVSAGGVPFPTHDEQGNALLGTSSLLPIFQTNYMKDIPKNVWDAINGTFSTPSAADLLEQLKQPEWTVSQVPQKVEESYGWAPFTLGGRILGNAKEGEWQGIWLPVNKKTGEALVEVPGGYESLVGKMHPSGKMYEIRTAESADTAREGGWSTRQRSGGGDAPWATGNRIFGTQNRFLTREGHLPADIQTKYEDLLKPFYEDMDSIFGTPQIAKFSPPMPLQSSPSGLTGLAPTQTINL